MPQSGGWLSMREHTRARLLDDVLGAVRPPSNTPGGVSETYVVLVLDRRATRVLNASVRAYDLSTRGVALIEGLEKKRQPFPDLDVVYLVEPTLDSMQLISADFTEGTPPLYANVNIFFTRFVNNEHLQELLLPLKSNNVLQRTKRVKVLSDANIDYLAVEEHTFHLDMQLGTIQLYNELKWRREQCIESSVNRLVTLCATLNEYPYIRYHASNAVAQEIAEKLKDRLNTMVELNRDFWWHGDGSTTSKVGVAKRERATLFVFDRTDDPVAPFLHELTYQAMVYDYIEVGDDDMVDLRTIPGAQPVKAPAGLSTTDANGTSTSDVTVVEGHHDKDMSAAATAKAEREKKAAKQAENELNMHLLSESDPLWVEYKHLHIAQVLGRLGEFAARYGDKAIHRLRKGQAADGGTDSQLSADEMIEAAQQVGEYREIMAKYGLHLKLAKACADGYNETLNEVEQDLATGVDEDGKAVSRTRLTSRVVELVSDRNVGLDNTIRLLALYMITSQQLLSEKDRRRLIEAANPKLPQSAQQLLYNLTFMLNPDQQQQAPSKRSAAASLLMRSRKPQLGRLQQAALDLAKTCAHKSTRYVPVVQQVIDSFCTGALTPSTYPYLIPPPEGAEQNMRAAAASSNKQGLSVKSQATGVPAAGWKGGGVGGRGANTNGSIGHSQSTGGAGRGGGNSGIGTGGGKGTDGGQFQGGRVLVFVAGGITHSELRGLHDVMGNHKREIVMGGTYVVRPKDMLRSLGCLDKENAAAFAAKVKAQEHQEEEDRRTARAAPQEQHAALQIGEDSKGEGRAGITDCLRNVCPCFRGKGAKGASVRQQKKNKTNGEGKNNIELQNMA